MQKAQIITDEICGNLRILILFEINLSIILLLQQLHLLRHE